MGISGGRAFRGVRPGRIFTQCLSRPGCGRLDGLDLQRATSFVGGGRGYGGGGGGGDGCWLLAAACNVLSGDGLVQ